jgi:uncharacterized membrane protein HdeD (DUF308 family)
VETGTRNERTSAQASVQEREGTRWATHQRLWWMELTRGIITFVSGLLFLTASFFAPRFFIYGLGSYLVIDGLLDLYGVRTSQGASQRKPLEYAGGAASLLSGLFSLVLPTLALLLLAALIAVRLLLTSFSQMRTARRARGRAIALLWAYSGLLALLGLFLLLFPLLAMTLLVVFLGSYMVVAGLFLLLRGVSLRFHSRSLEVSLPLPLPLPVSSGLSEDFPPSTHRAVIFVRRSAANGLGHIAWGFEWLNGWFNVGAVENLKQKFFANPTDMDFWATHTLDPLRTIQQRAYPYNEYKLFFVPEPRPKDAWKTVIWESRQPYSLVHHNCCDVAYEILCTYGCRELLDPAKEFIPNDWYDALPGRSYSIAASPAIPIRSHKQSRHQIATREIALVIPSHIKGSPPLWRKPRWRAWEELALVWEMMIGHVRTVCTSGIKLIVQRLHGGASQP